jgi:flagellar motility protein MotE (MotC chaperone)
MSRNRRSVLLAAALCLCGVASAHAETAAPVAAAVAAVAPAAAATPVAPAAMPAVADSPEAAQYCRNIANAASDARYARQALAIKVLEKELDDRIAKLEAKRAEYEDWMKRRQEFLDKADGAVVAIYSQMRPDAAAQQIAIMDPEAAAAILAKLNPRIASSILNEMPATTAAILTSVMAGLPKGLEGTPG